MASGESFRPEPKPKRERPPPPLDEGYLREQARQHMDRWVPSVQQLRVVLRRRVDRNLRFHGGDKEAGYALVEQVIAAFVKGGALDDERFTRAWLVSLQRRGLSKRVIRQRIRQKGVDGSVVDRLLAEHDAALREEEDVDPELSRAIAYCRRRRLGPWRTDPEQRAARREKDLGAMFRAGFAFDLARRCVDAESTEALEAKLAL